MHGQSFHFFWFLATFWKDEHPQVERMLPFWSDNIAPCVWGSQLFGQTAERFKRFAYDSYIEIGIAV